MTHLNGYRLSTISEGIVLCCFVTTLWNCNSHTIQSTHLKCTLQQFLVYSQGWAVISKSNFRMFLPSPREILYPLAFAFICHFSILQPQAITKLLWICLFWTFHTNGITQYVAFPDWFLSLSNTLLTFLHVFSWLDSSFLFSTEQYFTVYLFSHVVEIIGCFQILTIMDRAAINIHV